MGLSTISLGMSVSQEKKGKERKFIWPEGAVFTVMFLHEKQGEQGKRRALGAGATMEGELWSIFGAED
jgi:hypothetical protein